MALNKLNILNRLNKISAIGGGGSLQSYWIDPETGLLVRNGQVNHQFVIQAELVAGGFALAEGVGYETVGGELYVAVTGGKIREGVRGGYYVVDAEMTVGGFSGVEGVNWCNINGAY
jgi:hypothetical protein